MALVFCDSFDHYNVRTLGALGKWDVAYNANYSAGNGRNGTGCFLFTADHRFEKSLPAHATYIMGAALKINGGFNSTIFKFREGSTTHVDVRLTSAGVLQVTRNGTVLATGTTVLAANVWNHIEIKIVVHDSAGSVHLKINGNTEINISGQDTQNGGTGVINYFVMFGDWVGLDAYIDDMWFCDGSGSTNNDFLGDCRVQCLLPNGNGNSSQLVGSDGNSTDNYLLVDDPNAPDDDSTYVQSNVVDDKDTYAMGNLTPTSGTVYGVQVGLYAKKNDAGARSIKSVARSGASETDSAARALTTSYYHYFNILETKPGGGAWSISDVNAAEFGAKVA